MEKLYFLISAGDAADMPVFIPVIALIGMTALTAFLIYRFLFKLNFTDLKSNAEKVNKKKNVTASVIIVLAALGIMIWASGARRALNFALIGIAALAIGMLFRWICERFKISQPRGMIFGTPLMWLWFAAVWLLKVMELKMCVVMAVWFTMFFILWDVKIKKQAQLMALSRPAKILISTGITVLFIVVLGLLVYLIK